MELANYICSGGVWYIGKLNRTHHGLPINLLTGNLHVCIQCVLHKRRTAMHVLCECPGMARVRTQPTSIYRMDADQTKVRGLLSRLGGRLDMTLVNQTWDWRFEYHVRQHQHVRFLQLNMHFDNCMLIDQEESFPERQSEWVRAQLAVSKSGRDM